MFAVTRLADYAVVVLTELARPGLPLISASEIAERSGLPLPTVGKLLKALGRARIVVAERGVAGGYRLQRSPSSLPVLEVIEAVDGPIALTRCSLQASACERSGRCGVEQGWWPLNLAVRAALSSVTLADMLASYSSGAPPDPARHRGQLAPGAGHRRLTVAQNAEED